MNLKKLFSIALAIIISILLTGCSGSVEDYILYFELDEEPETLDPQLAEGMYEEVIVRNMFEGLTRIDGDGNIVNGAAEKIETSADGLTYTFTLKEGMKWSNGDPLRAEDFVFAFERAVDPKNKAPNVSAMFSVKNAEEIAKGNTDLALGVKAVSDKVLQIVLKEPNKEFLETLTSAICMPCNRNAFKSAKGKYGMNEDEIVSNGSFSMYYWDKEDDFRIRLLKNEEYVGQFIAQASSVVFTVGEFESRDEKLDKNSIDMGFINSTATTENTSKIEFSKTSYCLLINARSQLGKEEFKKAIMYSIDKKALGEALLPGLQATDTVIPQTVKAENEELAALSEAKFTTLYDPVLARESYLEGADKHGDPGSMVIIHHKNDAIRQMAMDIAEDMQSVLGVVVNLREVATETELVSKISAGEHSLAIAPITTVSASPIQFLSIFKSENNSNVYGFSDKDYDNVVNRLSANSSKEELTEATDNAVKLINESLILMPLVKSTETFGYAEIYNCPGMSPFDGIIDLALVTLKNS